MSVLVQATSPAKPQLEALVNSPMHLSVVRENWKYTSVARSLALFEHEATAAETVVAGTDQHGVMVDVATAPTDAQMRALIERASRCPPSARALLDATSVDRLVISGTLTNPLQVMRTNARRPLIIELTANCAATLDDLAEDSPTGWIHVHVGPGALLDYSRLRSQRSTSDWQRLVIVLERDATLRINHYATGAALRRLDALIVLTGEGANVDLSGCWTASAKEKLDQQWHVEHRAPHTTSRQVHHGIGDGDATTTFRGRIYIGADCRQANADLINRNLALSASATCNTKPELEIHNDDVRCSHGATVGQLPEDSVFYLRSRGFDAETAKRTLAAGFIRSAIRGSLASAARIALTGADDA